MEKLTEVPVSRKTEIQATKKVLAVIGVFIFTNLFNNIFGIIATTASIDIYSRNILNDISSVLIVLNSSVNVIIYGIFDPKFRQIFLDRFCSCSQTNKNEIQKNCQKVGEKQFQTSLADSDAHFIRKPWKKMNYTIPCILTPISLTQLLLEGNIKTFPSY